MQETKAGPAPRWCCGSVGRAAVLASGPPPAVATAGVSLGSQGLRDVVAEGPVATIGWAGPTAAWLERAGIYVMSPCPSTGTGGGLRWRPRHAPPTPCAPRRSVHATMKPV